MSRAFEVGQRVEFRSEWPFTISGGVVVAVGQRKREFGDGQETFVRVRWDRPYDNDERNRETTVPTWNGRLSAARVQKAPDCLIARLRARADQYSGREDGNGVLELLLSEVADELQAVPQAKRGRGLASMHYHMRVRTTFEQFVAEYLQEMAQLADEGSPVWLLVTEAEAAYRTALKARGVRL